MAAKQESAPPKADTMSPTASTTSKKKRFGLNFLRGRKSKTEVTTSRGDVMSDVTESTGIKKSGVNKVIPTNNPYAPPTTITTKSPKASKTKGSAKASSSTAKGITTTTTTGGGDAKRIKMKPSWLARRKFFIKMTDQSFDLVDADKSGEVDEQELYAGLLLIHLNLGMYAGPAACKPVSRERVHKVFAQMDVDGSGSLDRDEFREVMMILFSNVLLRVVTQWSMTLMIVPMVAQYILDGIYWLWNYTIYTIQHLDDDSQTFNMIELTLEGWRDDFIELVWTPFCNMIPDSIMNVFKQIGTIIDSIPDETWNTIPLTLLSCIMGAIVVPLIIFAIDDFFAKMAEKKKDEKEVVTA